MKLRNSEIDSVEDHTEDHDNEVNTRRLLADRVIHISHNSTDTDNGDFLPNVPSNRLTIIGRVRNLNDLTQLEVVLFATTILAVTVSLVFSILPFVDGNSGEMVFSILVIIDSLFVLFYLTHGIFIEEPFEMLALAGSLILLFVLFIVNFVTEVTSTHKEYVIKTVITSVSLTLTITTVVIALTLSWRYWISGNLVFKTVGGDMRLQSMCRLLLLAQSLLAFDAQFTILSLVLVVQQGFAHITNEQLLLLCSGSCLIAIWLFIGYFAMRLESSYLTWLFVATSLFQPLYILYLLVSSWIAVTPHLTYEVLNITMFICAAVCLVSHFSLIAVLACVSSNFGLGLCEKVYGTESQTKRVKEEDVVVPTAVMGEAEPLIRNDDMPSTSSSSQSSGRRNYSTMKQTYQQRPQEEEEEDGIYPA